MSIVFYLCIASSWSIHLKWGLLCSTSTPQPNLYELCMIFMIFHGSPQWLLLSDSLRVSVPASEQPGNVWNFFLISILRVAISCCKMNVSGSSVCMGFFPDSALFFFFFRVVRDIFLLWGLPARDEDFPLPLCPVLKTPLGTCFLPSPIFQDLRGPQLFLLLLFQGFIYISH